MLTSVPFLWSCDDQDVQPAPETETAVQPIVGGQLETGWDPVGAMTFKMTSLGYMGSFCSGTLIAPQWVLSAAHCLYASADLPIFPGLVHFYIGPNANSVMPAQPPPEGTLHTSDRFYIHPGYNPKWGGDDIALVHLSQPVEGVKPIPHNTTPFDKSILGKQILYVGFGANNGIQQSGSGVKRSGSMSMYTYDKGTYVSWYADAGVCFGDSGGPGLFAYDEQFRVIGVNSSVFSQNGDPCKGGAVQTRVDSYAPWIEKTMNDAPNCTKEPGLCLCPQACQADGACHNAMCEIFSCQEVLDCYDGCSGNPECRNRCYLRMSPLASTEMHNLGWCAYQKCNNSLDNKACVENKCGKYLDECKATPVGSEDCSYIFACQAVCKPEDSMCRASCFEKGTEAAQGQFRTLRDCFENHCSSLPEVGFEPSCGWDWCAAPLEICAPPSNCSLLGGDCPKGTACWMSPTGKYDCFPTDDVEEGGLCPLVPVVTRACEDGLQCVMAQDTTECRRVCTADEHCGQDEACQTAEFPGMEGWGYCDCRDDDGDGFCVVDDCDDHEAKTNPSKGEKCYDGKDNNCNGQVDEGCEAVAEESSVVESDEMDGNNDRVGCTASGAAPPAGAAWLLLAGLFSLIVIRRAVRR
jgi:hypothetical protein